MKQSEQREPRNTTPANPSTNGTSEALPADASLTEATESLQIEQPAEGAQRRRVGAKYAASVEHLRRRVYDFADLSAYPWRARLSIRLGDLFFYTLIRVIGMTLRWETRNPQYLEAIYRSNHRAIFTSWHSCIFTATYFWRGRGIVVMSSQSKDGEMTSRFVKRFGYGTARGSATRGAGRALAEMAECLASGIDAGFTIDGPKGPAYVAKPGAVTLARHSGQAIFPFHVAVKRYIELPSWDRLKIPLPFTRAITLMGEPIYVPRNATPEEVEARQAAVQQSLDELHQAGEQWRATR